VNALNILSERLDAFAAWLARATDSVLAWWAGLAGTAFGRRARAAWERGAPARERVAAVAGRYPPTALTGAALAVVVLAVGGALLAVRHEAVRQPVTVPGDPVAAQGVEPADPDPAAGAGAGAPAAVAPQAPARAGRPQAPNPLRLLRPDKRQLFQRSLDGAATGSGHRKPNYRQGKAEELARNRGPAAPAARSAGITDTLRAGPFSPSQFTVRNLYQGPVGDSWYLVYAGAGVGPGGTGPATGGVRVLAQSPAGVTTTRGTYLAPAGTGPLRVVSADGTVLTLAGPDGRRLSFDLSALAYR
jgi:hypothetical protein